MRKSLLSICVILLLGTVACIKKDNINLVKQVSLPCVTCGFDEEGVKTYSVWKEGADFHLLRSEDWSVALMSLASAAGSESATFSGETAGTKSGYYAITPASSVGSIFDNGLLGIAVEPRNIFTASENSATVTPQVATGQGSLTFKPIFGALKFNIGVDAVTFAEVNVPNKEHGLYGSYIYNMPLDVITEAKVAYSVTRVASEPIDVASDKALYVALPSGEYQSVYLVVRDDKAGVSKLFKAEAVEVEQGRVTKVDVSATELSFIVGSWHIKSFCGEAAEIDLYIKFDYMGCFTILQRSGDMAYVEYVGTYEIDNENSVISGEYSDGEKWANNYKFSLNSNSELVLESLSESGEVTTYESSGMPEVHISRVSAQAKMVKPL